MSFIPLTRRLIRFTGLSLIPPKQASNKFRYALRLALIAIVATLGRSTMNRANAENTIPSYLLHAFSDLLDSLNGTIQLCPVVHAVESFECLAFSYITYGVIRRTLKGGESWRSYALLWITHYRDWISVVSFGKAAAIGNLFVP